MAGQRTVYNLRLLRQDYSYTAQELADSLGIACTATILRWQKEGLRPIPHTRPLLFHSSEVKFFLDKRQKRRKKPCAPDETFCMKCQCPRHIQPNTLTTIPTANKLLRLSGACATCGSKMNKVIKPKEWGEKHPLYRFMKDGTEQHGGENQPHRSCSFEEGEQLCLNITL